jgi:hypothetical protein
MSYYDEIIMQDMPDKIKKIVIINSNLTKFPTFPNSIQNIEIRTTDIYSLHENFTRYPNLRWVKIGVVIEDNSIYPDTVFKHIQIVERTVIAAVIPNTHNIERINTYVN